MQVLDGQHHGALSDEPVEQAHPLLLEPLSGGTRIEFAGHVQPERESQDLPAAQPGEHGLRRVLLSKTELRPQHVGEWAESNASPVGETATEPEPNILGQPRPELTQDARLADSGLPDQADHSRPSRLDAPPELLVQGCQLPLAADEGCAQAPAAARAPRGHYADEPAAPDAFRLPLGLDGHGLVELEGPADQSGRTFPHEHLARPGALLQTSGHVDGVTGHEGAALAGPAHHDLASVHPDPKRQLLPEQLGQPGLHPQPHLQCPLCVVLLCRRRTEHGHDCVADELLDGPTPERDLRGHSVIEAIQHVPRFLRVQ